MPKKKEDAIFNILLSIEKTLKQQASNKRIFMQGILRGLGTAIGATVVLAIVTSLTVKFASALDWGIISEYFFTEVVQD